MSKNNCQELFLDDVISILVYKSSVCVTPIPSLAQTSSLTMDLSTASAIFKADITDKDEYVAMSDRPTLKITNSRSAAGNIYTHDLQIPVQSDREVVESAITQLQGHDFYIIYEKRDGSFEMSYSLPNTSVADIEESFSANSTFTVKMKVQSMSSLVKILPPPPEENIE